MRPRLPIEDSKRLRQRFPKGIPVIEAYDWLMIRGVGIATLKRLHAAGYVKASSGRGPRRTPLLGLDPPLPKSPRSSSR
jgi:hypothetical protein